MSAPDLWRWSPDLEAQIRKVIREELKSLLESVADVADGEERRYHYESGYDAESSALVMIEKVANETAQRLVCDHANTFNSMHGGKRCSSCGASIKD